MVPPALDRVVVGATDRDRDRRTPDARTMRAELDRAAAELPPAPPLTELASSVVAVDDVPPDRASTVTIPRTLSPKARRRQRFRRLWTVLSVLVVLAAAGWAVWTYVVPHTAIVPRLEGRPVEQAQRVAVARGFDFEISRNEFSSTVDPGLVISQSVPVGREVEEGSVLSVVVSKGPEFVDVPSVVGLPLGRAREEIQDARLTVGNVEKVFDNEVPKGEVIEQNPTEGQLEVDEAVDLTVSQGREPVEVPPVEGRPEGEAGSVLTGAGLRVSVDEDYSATVAEGDVISQSPQAGTVLRVGDTVTIVISLGPRRFPMPDVVGMGEAQATARLEGLNLRVDAVDLPSGGSSVVGQRPEPGTTVEEGDKVTIYVGG
jgi:serine/threonine-protein kinase